MEGTDISGAPLVQTDLQQKEEELFTLRKALSLTFFDITSLKLKAESIQSAIQDSQSCDVSSVQSLLDDIFSLRTHIADSYALPTVDPPSLVHSDCSLPDELSSVDELERSIDTLRTVVDENGSVLDHLQTIHLDFEKEYAALPQRLSALHANNAHLHSIIDDQHSGAKRRDHSEGRGNRQTEGRLHQHDLLHGRANRIPRCRRRNCTYCL